MNFISADKNNEFEHYAFFYGVDKLHYEYESFCISNKIKHRYIKRSGWIDFQAYTTCRKFIKSNSIFFIILHTFSMTPFYFFSKRNYKIIIIDHTSPQFKTKVEWIYSMWNIIKSDYYCIFYPQQFEAVLKKLGWILNKPKAQPILLKKTVNTDHFKPDGLKKSDGFFTLGMAGRLTLGKRHDLLIEAIYSLNQRGVKVKLKFAGSGSLIEKYKNVIVNKELEELIEFEGSLNQDEIVGFYNSLDAYIHATEGETICYSILEAQACGLPILASNVHGVNNVIKQHVDGLLFNNNIESICDVISEALRLELLKRMSVRSRELAERNSKMNDPVGQIYQMIKV